MDVLTGLLVSVVLIAVTVIQTWINRGQFEKQDRRIERLEDHVERRFDQQAADMAALRSEFGAQMAAMRSDLTQIALALGLRARPETG